MSSRSSTDEPEHHAERVLVEVTRDDDVAVLTLNRPEARNALSIEMCDAITNALEDIDDSDVRAVVIVGAGKSFCAGADFAAVSGAGGVGFLPAFERMLEAIARHRLPTVAAIHGAALGGGLQLATVCDFRIAAEDAALGIPSARIGILVNFENVQRLVLLAGIGVAKDVLMTGRNYSGPEAERLGLVTRVAADPREAALELAHELAQRAPLSVQGVKRSIQHVADHLAAVPTAELVDLVVQAYSSEDLQEGLAALNERRPPHFKGR